MHIRMHDRQFYKQHMLGSKHQIPFHGKLTGQMSGLDNDTRDQIPFHGKLTPQMYGIESDIKHQIPSR